MRKNVCHKCDVPMQEKNGTEWICPSCMSERKRKIYQANREYYAEKNRRWVQENPTKNRIRVGRRKVLKREARGSHTAEEWLWLLAFWGGRCLKCGTTERIERDHVIPVSRGGDDTMFNLQPLCRSCNSSKRAKAIDYRDRDRMDEFFEKAMALVD